MYMHILEVDLNYWQCKLLWNWNKFNFILSQKTFWEQEKVNVKRVFAATVDVKSVWPPLPPTPPNGDPHVLSFVDKDWNIEGKNFETSASTVADVMGVALTPR